MAPKDPWRSGVPDLFHRYQDTRLRRARGLGNGAQFCFDLGGHVDVELLQARVDAIVEAAPILTAGMAPWPRTRWSPVPGHRVIVQEEEVEGTAEDWFSRWYGEPFPSIQEPSLQILLGRHEHGAAVLIRFLHVLTDAAGLDLLCQMLDGADPARFMMRDEQGLITKRAAGGRPLWKRALQAHNFALRHFLTSFWPVFQPRNDPNARQCVLTRSLTAAESATVDARMESMAGALDRSSFFIALSARAAVRAWKPKRWHVLRIPVPVSIRPPAWRGPVLNNFLTMVLISVPVWKLGTLEEAVQTVQASWRRAFERGEDAANMVMLGAAKWLPYPLMRLFLDGPPLKDGSTLHYSYFEMKTGKDGTFLGLPIRSFVSASSVLAPPGSAFLAARCAGRLTLLIPGQGGPLNEALLREATALALGEVD
jgi:hypothetical protein